MKQILSVLFIVTLTFSINSCSRNETEIQLEPTVESLSKSQNFKDLNMLFFNLFDNEKNTAILKQLSAKDKLTNKETQDLFSSLGFENEKEFNDFQTKLIEINTNLANEFDFKKLDNNKKNELFLKALSREKPAEPVFEDGSGAEDTSICGQQYSACKQSAWGAYIITATGCVAGGLGIAAGSAGWASPVGGALAGACLAGAEIQYEGVVKQCYYSYLQCKKSN